MRLRASYVTGLLVCLLWAGSGTAQEWSQWGKSMVIGLNTTADGADVAADVADFPVLIRLNESNFDFSSAGENGDGIRFTDPDGNVLSYEIEHWDVAAKTAAIWVRVDTVRGNSGNQRLIMYWANTDAEAASSSESVFDTLSGFVGVWHMNNDPSAAAPQLMDATPNGINGSAVGSLTSTDLVPGIAGNATNFNGTDACYNLGNGPKVDITGDKDVTLSAWVKLDGTPHTENSYETILAKGDKQYSIQYRSHQVRQWQAFVHDGDKWKTAALTDTPSTEKYYHVTGVFDDSVGKVALYIDGAQVDSFPAADSINAERDDTLGIGANFRHNGLRRFLDGIIDEVRFSSVARSEHWVKLCYESQKDSQSLVEYGQIQDPSPVIEDLSSSEIRRGAGSGNYRIVDLRGRALTRGNTVGGLGISGLSRPGVYIVVPGNGKATKHMATRPMTGR